jgi:murein L,D-transpeptidase YafK
MKKLFLFTLCILSSCNVSNSKITKKIKNVLDRKEHVQNISHEKTTNCNGKETSIYVNTTERKLYVCNDSKTVQKFDVSLGSGGVGKTKLGDRKTPLGQYWLGKPRKSRKKYHTFIHIGYPSIEQQAAGYSGGDVGIHGPPRKWKNAGKRNTKKNWGAGCVVVGSDKEITQIKNHVNKYKIKNIILL